LNVFFRGRRLPRRTNQKSPVFSGREEERAYGKDFPKKKYKDDEYNGAELEAKAFESWLEATNQVKHRDFDGRVDLLTGLLLQAEEEGKKAAEKENQERGVELALLLITPDFEDKRFKEFLKARGLSLREGGRTGDALGSALNSLTNIQLWNRFVAFLLGGEKTDLKEG